MTEDLHFICCFTGHRHIDLPKLALLAEELDRVLDILIRGQVKTFRTGGAMGFDTLAALKVLEKKEQNPALSLELCLPCKDQTKGWNDRNQEAYDYILGRADKIIYLHEAYTKSCMLERNRYMVDGANYCIGYCTSQKGGTAYTMQYAQKKGLQVINLADRVAGATKFTEYS